MLCVAWSRWSWRSPPSGAAPAAEIARWRWALEQRWVHISVSGITDFGSSPGKQKCLQRINFSFLWLEGAKVWGGDSDEDCSNANGGGGFHYLPCEEHRSWALILEDENYAEYLAWISLYGAPFKESAYHYSEFEFIISKLHIKGLHQLRCPKYPTFRIHLPNSSHYEPYITRPNAPDLSLDPCKKMKLMDFNPLIDCTIAYV